MALRDMTNKLLVDGETYSTGIGELYLVYSEGGSTTATDPAGHTFRVMQYGEFTGKTIPASGLRQPTASDLERSDGDAEALMQARRVASKPTKAFALKRISVEA